MLSRLEAATEPYGQVVDFLSSWGVASRRCGPNKAGDCGVRFSNH